MNSDNVSFYYSKKLIVNIISDQIKLENIELRVEYSEDNPAPIIGYFKCGKEKSEELQKITNQHTSFKVESITQSKTSYFSDDATIKNFINSDRELYLEGEIEMYNFYSKFEFLDEKAKYNHFDHNERVFKPIEEKRFLEFQLVGANSIWNRAFIHEIKKSDTKFINEVNLKNTFVIDNFQCSYYVKDINFKTNSETEYYEISKKRVFFRIEEIIDSDSDDNNFKTTIINFFEEILLLISFVGSSNIDWLIYKFNGKEYNIWYLKSFLNSEKLSSVRTKLIIETHYLNKFLINSHKKLKELEKNINLLIPIREYLSNEFAIYLEQHFLIIYIAFEKLTNDISNWLFKSEFILDNGRFKKLKSEFQTYLKSSSQFNLDEEELEKISEKLTELNRTSQKRKLEMLFKHFQIPYEKSLDEKGQFRFLSFRNKYVHSTKDYDDIGLLDEYSRLKKYFELIVLKLLDKDSLVHLHPDFKFMWERYIK